MQREVLKLFLDAYGTSDGPLKAFILRSIRHHVAHAQDERVPLHEDELLMRALTHNASVLCARAVAGIGVKRIEEIIEKYEAGGEWWAAAQLWFATSMLHGQRAGTELKRAWAAIGHVQPESEQSRALEGRVLNQLMLAANGYTFGSRENAQVKERMATLSQQAQSIETNHPASHMPDAA